MIDTKTIGARIKTLRSEKGWGQEELSRKMGYSSFTTVSKWELGQNIPNVSKLVELARVLDTSTDYILFGRRQATTNTITTNNGLNDIENISGGVTINNTTVTINNTTAEPIPVTVHNTDDAVEAQDSALETQKEILEVQKEILKVQKQILKELKGLKK